VPSTTRQQLSSMELIESEAKKYFPNINRENFNFYCGINIEYFHILLEVIEVNIRNLCLTLYTSRYGQPFAIIGSFFQMSETNARDIYYTTSDIIIQKLSWVISFDLKDKHLTESDLNFINYMELNCCLVVDGTECPINNISNETYSGKSGCCTFKYQVIVNLVGWICSIIGPVTGNVNDTRLYRESNVSVYLKNEDLWCIGDKGYEGLEEENLISPYKGHRYQLLPSQREYNQRIYSKRQIVERIFGKIKEWKILANVYRSHSDVPRALELHSKIFYSISIVFQFKKLLEMELNMGNL